MLRLIPFLLMLGSFGVILVILVKRYPQLTLLNVEEIQKVKQEKKKKEFWVKRAEEKARETQKKMQSAFSPIWERIKQYQLVFRKYVGKVERILLLHVQKRREQAPKVIKERQKEEVRQWVKDGTFALEQNDLELAEAKFIAAIRLDPRNVDAYRGLGDVYARLGQYAEAAETYQFLLKISPRDDQVYVRLAELAEQQGNIEDAIQYYQQAVLMNDSLSSRFAKLAELLKEVGEYETALAASREAVDLEPQNPKYLDNLIEVSILAGHKNIAEEALQQFRMVNPENQKIDIFRDRMNGMPS